MEVHDQWEMPDLLRISDKEGKYTVVQKAGGGTEVLRYGEPWLGHGKGSFPGVNMVLSFAYELEEARKQLEEWQRLLAAKVPPEELLELVERLKLRCADHSPMRRSDGRWVVPVIDNELDQLLNALSERPFEPEPPEIPQELHRSIYYCTRCKSIVRQAEDLGEFTAGVCNCTHSPSPWTPVDFEFAGLAARFRPGGTELPKSITNCRPLLKDAKSVSTPVALQMMTYLDAAYERLHERDAYIFQLQSENARLKSAGAKLVEDCDQLAIDTAPMFAEFELGRGRGPYKGRQIGNAVEAMRALLGENGDKRLALLPGLDHIANFIQAIDLEGLSARDFHLLVRNECMKPGGRPLNTPEDRPAVAAEHDSGPRRTEWPAADDARWERLRGGAEAEEEMRPVLPGEVELHNGMAAILCQSIIVGSVDKEMALVVLESIIVGLMARYNIPPKMAAALMDEIKDGVVERLGGNDGS